MQRAISGDVIAPIARALDAAIASRDAATLEDAVSRLLRASRPALLDALQGAAPDPATRAAPVG
jgi:hypothetical protein